MKKFLNRIHTKVYNYNPNSAFNGDYKTLYIAPVVGLFILGVIFLPALF